MARTNRRAGQNVRELAFKRRVKAIVAFVSAGLVIFLPFFLIKGLERFLKQLSTLNPAQAHTSLNLPPTFYLLFVLAALGLVAKGTFWWRRADHADQGAKGEEAIAQTMLQLEQENWKIEYGMRLGGGLGDADIVCISPKQKAYVIDVKSHRGEVITDGQRLLKQMGKQTYPFEKDFLSQVTRQALQVKQQKNLNYVTPIVAFSDARVSVPSGKLQKVYVVEKARLVALLKSLG